MGEYKDFYTAVFLSVLIRVVRGYGLAVAMSVAFPLKIFRKTTQVGYQLLPNAFCPSFREDAI